VGLTDRARVRYAAYGAGPRRLLGVAAALLKDPDLLVLDEPWRDLDADACGRLDALLRELAAGGCAVLVTGEPATGFAACDRVAVLANGRVVAEMTGGARGRAASEGACEPVGDAGGRVLSEAGWGGRGG
jgi:ABC-2 type transport system ATP-binding protein